jgi:hypothetical protein
MYQNNLGTLYDDLKKAHPRSMKGLQQMQGAYKFIEQGTHQSCHIYDTHDGARIIRAKTTSL